MGNRIEMSSQILHFSLSFIGLVSSGVLLLGRIPIAVSATSIGSVISHSHNVEVTASSALGQCILLRQYQEVQLFLSTMSGWQ